jgi:hypothetical protein
VPYKPAAVFPLTNPPTRAVINTDEIVSLAAQNAKTTLVTMTNGTQFIVKGSLATVRRELEMNGLIR